MVASAFILGGGNNALSIVRSLGKASIPTHLFGVEKDDIACHSKYGTASYLPDGTNPEAVIHQINTASQFLSTKPVLLITSDEYLEIVSSNRNELSKYCDFNIPSTNSVNKVLDKSLFSSFCEFEKLPAPQSWSPVSNAQLDVCIEQANFPVIIKPVFAHKSEEYNFNNEGKFAKMILVDTVAELKKYFFVFTERGAKLLIQEYIDGPDNEHYSYCSYRDAEHKELAGFCVRKLRIFPVHGGAGTYAELVDYAEMTNLARLAVDKLQYTGVSSVCFKRETKTGRLMIHEVNGRFPVGHSASQLGGVDLPIIAYRDAIGAQLQPASIYIPSGKWLLLNSDISAYRGYRAEGELSFFAWISSLFQVRYCVEFAHNDMGPFLFLIRNMFKRVFRKIISCHKEGNE